MKPGLPRSELGAAPSYNPTHEEGHKTMERLKRKEDGEIHSIPGNPKKSLRRPGRPVLLVSALSLAILLTLGGTPAFVTDKLPARLASELAVSEASATGTCRTQNHYHAVAGEAHYTNLWKYARRYSVKTRKVTRYKIYRTVAVNNDGFSYILGYCWVKY